MKTKSLLYSILAGALLFAVSGTLSAQNMSACGHAQVATDDSEWVNIGLPSGTLWKSANEPGIFGYYDATSRYGSCLPTKEELQELKDVCQWLWTGSGFKVTGPNGKSIYLPAEGYRHFDGSKYGSGTYGNYWSRTPDDTGKAWELYFYRGGIYTNSNSISEGLSVRLVRRPRRR